MLKGMAINVETRQALLGNLSGGLSGPAIKPVALYMVWECYEEVDIPIIGAGGVSTVQDAIEFLLAGARAIQVGGNRGRWSKSSRVFEITSLL